MAKRLISLSRLNIVLFILALVALVHRVDSGDLRQDIRALDLIEKVIADTNLRDLFETGSAFTAALTWLQTQDSATAEHNYQVRDQLMRLLQDQGINEENLIRVKGRDDFLPIDRFRLIDIPLDEPLTDSPLDTAALTVEETLAAFERLTEPRLLNIAVELHEPALINLASFRDQQQIAEDPVAEVSDNQPGPPDAQLLLPPGFEDSSLSPGPTLILESVALHSNVVTLRYTEDFSFNVSQTLPESFTDTVHVATVQMIGPSLYELKNGPNTEVAALRAAIEHRSRLHAIYGTMKFGLAQNIVTEEFIRAYKSIDILGFTISTHRYPFAILLIAFVTSWGIAWTVEAARRTKKQVLRELHDEDVVDAVLDFPLMRFVIWVLLPALAIWASLPLFPLSSLEQATVIGGTLLMLAISSITWARASQL